MRYFKKNGYVYAFDSTQLYLVTDEYTELTQAEREAHLNPEFTQVYAPLKPRQFKLALLDAGLIDDVEQAIEAIEDETLKRKIQIEYQYASEFERENESVIHMIDLLQLDKNQVDSIWAKALTF